MCRIIDVSKVRDIFSNINKESITPEEIEKTLQDKLHTELKHIPYIKAFIKTNMEDNGYIYNEDNKIYIRRVK